MGKPAELVVFRIKISATQNPAFLVCLQRLMIGRLVDELRSNLCHTELGERATLCRSGRRTEIMPVVPLDVYEID